MGGGKEDGEAGFLSKGSGQVGVFACSSDV